MSGQCPRCHNIGDPPHDPIADARCALRAAVREDVWAHAQQLDRAPTRHEVDDLLAHLGDMYSDTARAHRAARTVLDLGWRPAFGATA